MGLQGCFRLFLLFYRVISVCIKQKLCYCFNSQANINGATMVASDSTINLGV